MVWPNAILEGLYFVKTFRITGCYFLNSQILLTYSWYNLIYTNSYPRLFYRFKLIFSRCAFDIHQLLITKNVSINSNSLRFKLSQRYMICPQFIKKAYHAPLGWECLYNNLFRSHVLIIYNCFQFKLFCHLQFFCLFTFSLPLVTILSKK